MGVLLGAQTLRTATDAERSVDPRIPQAAFLSIPLIMVYCLVVGLRFIFGLPADLRRKLDLQTTNRSGTGRCCWAGTDAFLDASRTMPAAGRLSRIPLSLELETGSATPTLCHRHDRAAGRDHDFETAHVSVQLLVAGI